MKRYSAFALLKGAPLCRAMPANLCSKAIRVKAQGITKKFDR